MYQDHEWQLLRNCALSLSLFSLCLCPFEHMFLCLVVFALVRNQHAPDSPPDTRTRTDSTIYKNPYELISLVIHDHSI